MNIMHTKEGLTQMLQNNLTKSYKRKRMKRDNGANVSSECAKNDDMDIEESDDENNGSPVMFPEPRPSSQSNNVTNESVAGCSSETDEQMSLNDLRRKQEELLRALADAGSDADESNSMPSNKNSPACKDSPDSPENDEGNDETHANDKDGDNKKVDEKPAVEEIACVVAEVTQTEQTEQSMQHDEVVLGTPTKSGRSTESVFGTPLLQQVSPFTTLPTGAKWSVGVSDVIDFENLPDATGTYHKLSGIIQKIRTVVKQINEDSDNES